MNRSLRILHIGNGRAYKIKAIVDAFLERGHKLHMIPIPPSDGAWEGVTWHRVPIKGPPGPAAVLARLFQVRRLVRELRPDVVHAHNAWGPGWYGAFAGAHPLVIQAYGGDLLDDQCEGRPLLQQRLTSWTFRAADRVIVTGRHMIDAAVSHGVSHDHVLHIPRGVDLERYRSGLDTRAFRERLGLGDKVHPVILSPRYQVDETLYNLDTVIEAFVELRTQFPSALCLQLFDPQREAARSRLQTMASERGLAQSYRLVPKVDNQTMPLFYNLADIVVSVPSSDGFPVTVLEAAACGVPVVASRLPYCAEWFVDGENGFLVPVRSPKALSEALATVCNNAELRHRIGAASRSLVEQRADCRRCMDDLEAAYFELCVGGTQARGSAA